MHPISLYSIQAVKNHQAKSESLVNTESAKTPDNETIEQLDPKPSISNGSNHVQETASESPQSSNGLEHDQVDQSNVETQISHDEAVLKANLKSVNLPQTDLEMESPPLQNDNCDLKTKLVFVEKALDASNHETESIPMENTEETFHAELPPIVEANKISTTEAAPNNIPSPLNHPSTSTDSTVTESVNFQESSGFTVELTSESMELIGTDNEYDNVRTDLRIDDDVAKVLSFLIWQLSKTWKISYSSVLLFFCS